MDQRLLDLTYAAAVDESALFELLENLSRRFSSRVAGLFRVNQGQLVWERSVGMPSGFMTRFASDYVHLDPRISIARQHPVGTVLCDGDDAIRALIAESPILDFVESNDLHYTAGVQLWDNGSEVANFYISRAREEQVPGIDVLQEIYQLTPHLTRAMQVRRMHQLLAGASQRSDSELVAGQMFIDRDARLRWLDANAEHLLESTGLAYVSCSRLRWRDSKDQQWFEQAIHSLSHNGCALGTLTYTTESRHGRLRMRVLPPMPEQLVPPTLFASARNWHCLILEWLSTDRCNWPDLTPRQLQVLRLLGEGLSSTRVAQRLGCSQATLRNHAQQLLERFGVSNRIEMLNQARRLGLLDHD